MQKMYNGLKVFIMGQYPAIYLPKHKRALTNGAVYVHYLVAESILGRPLKDTECVHHVDENKFNFNKDNIWIFNTVQDHAKYHKCLKDNCDFVLIKKNKIYFCLVESYYIDQALNIEKKAFKHAHQKLCPKCGTVISTAATYCNKCYKIENSKHIPTAQILLLDFKELHSFTEMGIKYQVSYTAIKKWFKRYNLPYKTQDLDDYISKHNI